MQEFSRQLELLKEQFIIVEGKKDRKALASLGIKHVRILNKPLFAVCEEVAKTHREVVILTDLDKEGRRLYSKIKENLERLGVKVNDTFRIFLYKETQLAHIEGIDTYVKKVLV